MALIKSLSSGDLDDVIARAQAKQWAQLTLIGPGSYIRPHEQLPEELKKSSFVFRLLAFDNHLANKLTSLSNLTSLNLEGNNIGAEGAKTLTVLSNLTSLYLSHSNIGDEEVQALTALSNLTLLYLWSNKVGDEGAKALTVLSNLTLLHLGSNVSASKSTY